MLLVISRGNRLSKENKVFGYALYAEGLQAYVKFYLDVDGKELSHIWLLASREEARQAKRKLEESPENGQIRIIRFAKDKGVR